MPIDRCESCHSTRHGEVLSCSLFRFSFFDFPDVLCVALSVCSIFSSRFQCRLAHDCYTSSKVCPLLYLWLLDVYGVLRDSIWTKGANGKHAHYITSTIYRDIFRKYVGDLVFHLQHGLSCRCSHDEEVTCSSAHVEGEIQGRSYRLPLRNGSIGSSARGFTVVLHFLFARRIGRSVVCFVCHVAYGKASHCRVCQVTSHDCESMFRYHLTRTWSTRMMLSNT